MIRFERFTERAQDAATRAYEILQRYGHNQVDTEHMLLALLEQPDGVILQILERMGVDALHDAGFVQKAVVAWAPEGKLAPVLSADSSACGHDLIAVARLRTGRGIQRMLDH